MFRTLRALFRLADLVDLHRLALLAGKRRLTVALTIGGKPVRLPVLAICPVTGRYLIETPDQGLRLIPGRDSALSEKPPAI